jgi:hypothetical protein
VSGFDHHSASYRMLNCNCDRHYLYSYSNNSGDGDAQLLCQHGPRVVDGDGRLHQQRGRRPRVLRGDALILETARERA